MNVAANLLHYFAVACVALIAIAVITVLAGGLYFSVRRKMHLRRMACPACGGLFGTSAISIAEAKREQARTEYVAGLNIGPNEFVDIHFDDVLTLTCPHCGREHDTDLDRMHIGAD